MSGSVFKSVKPVTVCTDWRIISNGQGEEADVEVGMLQCLAEKTVQVTYPTTFELTVTSMSGVPYASTLFTKSYTVRNCQ